MAIFANMCISGNLGKFGELSPFSPFPFHHWSNLGEFGELFSFSPLHAFLDISAFKGAVSCYFSKTSKH